MAPVSCFVQSLVICLLMSFIISNMETESFPNTALRESSHRISRLLDGFCKSLSLMYDQLDEKWVDLVKEKREAEEDECK